MRLTFFFIVSTVAAVVAAFVVMLCGVFVLNGGFFHGDPMGSTITSSLALFAAIAAWYYSFRIVMRRAERLDAERLQKDR